MYGRAADRPHEAMHVPPLNQTDERQAWSGQLYHAAFEGSRDAIVLLEGERFVECNAAAVAIFGAVTKDVLMHARPADFSPARQPDGSPSEKLARKHIDDAKRQGSARFEWTHRTLDGKVFLCEVLLSRIEIDGRTLIQGVIRDITSRRQMERALHETNKQVEHFRALVEDAIDQSGIGLFIIDRDYRIVWVSQPITGFMGIDTGQAVGEDMRAVVRDEMRGLFHDGDRFVRSVIAAYDNNSRIEGRIYRVLPQHGLAERWLEHQSYPITSGHYAGGRIDIYRDLSDRIKLENELSHRATHDYLTGLLNRQQFEVLMEQEILRTTRYDTPLSLIMLDIDGFKHVNDTWGHDTGDRALKHLAKCLRGAIRSMDSLARWGGEEFMLMLPECSLENAAQMAENLRQRIQCEPFGDGVDKLTISLGVTRYEPSESPRDVLKRADDALYSAKQRGRNRVVVAD